jgi:transcriptional regulator NrdR family protein
MIKSKCPNCKKEIIKFISTRIPFDMKHLKCQNCSKEYTLWQTIKEKVK